MKIHSLFHSQHTKRYLKRLAVVGSLLFTVYCLLFTAVPKAHADLGDSKIGTPFSQFVTDFNTAVGIKPDFSSNPFISFIIGQLLPYAIVIAGLILFIMLLRGGFDLLTSTNSPEQAEQGKKIITASITGFLIIFAAYWIAQIIQVVLGINILQ